MNPSQLNIEAIRSRNAEFVRVAAIERRTATRTETPAPKSARRAVRLVTFKSLRARFGTA